MNSSGQGSLSFGPKSQPNVPPFPANAADNGLSVDPITGHIVLGNNAGDLSAMLLSNRHIPLNGFQLRANTALTGTAVFRLDDALQEWEIGSTSNQNVLRLRNTGPNDSTVLGDVNSVNDGLRMTITPVPAFAQILLHDNNRRYLDVGPLGASLFGNSPGNFNRLEFNEGADQGVIRNTSHGDVLDIRSTLGTYQFGNISGIGGNGLAMLLDDINGRFFVDNNAGALLDLNRNTSIYRMGEISGGSGTIININDVTRKVRLESGSTLMLDTDPVGRFYALGDCNNTFGGTRIEVQDGPVSKRVQVNADLGIRITGDPVLLHTGTALTNAAGAGAGTLTNAPTAGNPTKWITIDDNGTVRKIPTWT